MDEAVPGWARDMDYVRSSVRTSVDWPDWCLVPMSAAYAVVSGGGGNRVPLEDMGMVAAMAALYAWRVGRDIWRVDQELAETVLTTDMGGEIPSQVFYRLPGWCAYLVNPGCEGWPDELAGAWCHLEWDVRSKRAELRLVFDLGTGDQSGQTFAIPLHLGAGRTVADVHPVLVGTGQVTPVVRDVLPSPDE